MKLITLHGRKSPDDEMPDWGFSGPTLHGIAAVHWTYGTMNVFFTDVAAAKEAHRLTGWTFFDDHALEMAFSDDLLMIKPEGGDVAYFGDFELQDDKEAA
jgi:hypothetical protein